MGTINAQRPGSGHGWCPLEAALINSEGLTGAFLTQQAAEGALVCLFPATAPPGSKGNWGYLKPGSVLFLPRHLFGILKASSAKPKVPKGHM